MDPRSQVLLRQADHFTPEKLLLAGAPADHLLAEWPQASAWSWLADEYRVLQRAGTAHYGHQLPQLAVADAVLFLPKSRELTEYLLHTLAGLPGMQRLFLVGEKKAGIERAAKQLAQFGKTWKLDSARHCQLWLCELGPPAGLPPAPEQWQQQFSVALPGAEPLQLCSLPGVFSHGRLDRGTALLLEHLDDLPAGHLLDFGCGAGVLGAALKRRYPHCMVSLLDVDAFALESSRRTLAANGLEAQVLAGAGIADAPGQLAAIVTNPPFHKGVHTHYQATEELIRQAAGHLLPGGELRLVANSFLRYPELIEAHLGPCRVLAERDGFRVYSARRGQERSKK